MAVQFAIPSGPAINNLNIDYFKGVDLYNDSANVEPYRSPEAPNMIRDEVGKVRKRMGYHTLFTFPGKINGVYSLNGKLVVHSGTGLYVEQVKPAEESGGGDTVELFGGRDDETPEIPPIEGGGGTVDISDPVLGPDGELVETYKKVAGGLADRKSWGARFGERLFLLDGESIHVFDGKTVQEIEELATVPVVVIAKAPGGGGTPLNPFNLLSRKWTEQFIGTADAKEYRLYSGGLDADTVTVEVAQEDGSWAALTEGTDFTVNRETGVVTFKTAPGAPFVAGTDNVKITAAKTREGYRDRILKCTTGVLYGANGAQDRLFLTGNPQYPNLDFYSEFNDPTYFGDECYCQVGQDDGRIVGYSIVGNMLAAHKSEGADGRNIVVRTGMLDSAGKAVFPVTNTIHGEAAIARRAFGSLEEPLFLTRLGIYAITAKELTGERYSQQRSLYLSGALLNETGLEDAEAATWKDFYLLAVNGRVYLLDGRQKEYARDAPQSSYQYEGYYWENVPARVWWTDGERLAFGTEDGRICEFYSAPDDPESYNDDGKAIVAYWDTPNLDGRYFWKNKTFRYVSCRLASAVVTGVKIFAQVRGLWRQIFDAGQKARYLDWSYINFEKFVFSADRTPRTLGGKIKLKKVDKVRFRFQNGELNEPFGLYSIGFEYTEPGSRYKG